MKKLVLLLEEKTRTFLKSDVRYLAYSGFWSNATSVVVTLLSLALYLVFANFLSKETYGTYQYLLSIAALLGSLTLTGMNTSVARAVAQGFDGAVRQALWYQLKLAWIPFIVAVCGSLFFLNGGEIILAIGIFLSGIFIPLSNAFNTYSAYLHGKRDFKNGFLYNTAINLPFYGSLISLALLSDSPVVLLAGNLVVQTAAYFVALCVVLRRIPKHARREPDSLSFGTHLSVMGVFSALAAQLDSVLAFHYLGAAQLAVYAFATAIPDRLAGLLKFLPAAALPSFSNRSEAEVRQGILLRLPLLTVGLLIIAGIYALGAPFVYRILFPAYTEAISYSQVYGLVLFGIVTQVILAALSAHGRIRSLYVFNIVVPLTQVGLQLLGVLLYGLWGLIFARIATVLFALVFSMGLLLKR